MLSGISRWGAALWVIAVTQIAITPVFSSCGLNWYPPSNHFDGVNERGAVSYWEEIDAIDMGGDLKIPLIFNFRSDRNTSSNYLGSGWLLALLESHFYQTNERNFVMVQPDGPNRYFYRANPQDTLLKDRGGWAAEIKEDTITAWAECGWKLVFKKGKLTAMQTPENRKLDFVYSGNRIVEIREGAKSHLKAVIDSSSGSITGLEFNGRHIGIELDNRPMVQNVNGQNLVAGMAPSLRRLTGVPNGPKEFRFAVNEKLQPTFTVAGKPDRVMTWDPATKTIVSDNSWQYTIEQGKDVFANAVIQRKNAVGDTESWHYDRARGLEMELGLGGVSKVTSYFTTGVLAGKLRRVEETAKGKTKVLRDLSYNEKGQLVRERDMDGVMTVFSYDDHSRLTEIMRDGTPFARRAYDDKNRVTEEDVFGVDKTTYRYLENGGFEKTTVNSLGGETVRLVYDKTEKLIDGVFSNGRGLSLDGEYVPNIIPTTTEKRDALIKELADNLVQLKDPIARGELLIRIGSLYTDETLGPSDPYTAIKVFESILLDPTMDDYSKAQAHSWITSKHIEIGRSEWPKGVKQMEQLLALKGDGLSPERRESLRGEQTQGFRMMLALMRTGQPKNDEILWNAMLKKYCSSEDFKKQLDYLLAEQKRELSIQYLNN